MQTALPPWLAGGRRRTPSATLIRRRTTKRRSRAWIAKRLMLAGALTCIVAVMAFIVAAFRPLPGLGHFMSLPSAAFAATGSIEDGPASLIVRSEPSAARVTLDGRERGRTPLELNTFTGQHALRLDRDGLIDSAETVEVAANGTAVDVALWTRQPTVRHLRPAYPGAHLVDGAFLSDGTVQLIDALQDHQAGQPARSLREAWLIEAAPRSDHAASSGPTGPRAAAVAVSPDGRRIATLQDASRVRPTGPSAGASASRLDSVWVGSTSTRADHGSAVYRLEPTTTTVVGIVAQEELGGLAWLPDSRHLLVGSRFGDPATVGPARTRLLIVDAGVDGGEQLDPRPVELIVVPAEVLLESVVWSPDARRVAVILRAPAAPGAKRLVGLGVLDVSQPAVSSFQYVADLGSSDSPAGRLPVAPVAWEPCQMEDGCAAEQRLAYTAPVLNTAQAAAGPLSFLGLGRAPSTTPGGLYVSTLGAATLAIGDAPRLGSATGIIGLAWRSLGQGVNEATLVGLARGAGNTLALRAIDPTTGRVQDLGVQLPPEVAAGSGAVGVRWDTLHARALVVARSSDRAIAGTEAVDVWLVDFSATSAEAR